MVDNALRCLGESRGTPVQTITCVDHVLIVGPRPRKWRAIGRAELLGSQRSDPTTSASPPNSREIQAAYGDPHTGHDANARANTALTTLGAAGGAPEWRGGRALALTHCDTRRHRLSSTAQRAHAPAGQSPDGTLAALYPRPACSHTRAGTGNCIGINDDKILCRCPPWLASFFASLHANIAAGHGVRSSGISISFPRGRCPAIQCTHIKASIATLHKLRGVGCDSMLATRYSR